MSTAAEHLNHASGIDPYCDACSRIRTLHSTTYCETWDTPLKKNGAFIVRAWNCQRDGTKDKSSND